jgi:putative oxidoreductase
MNFGPLILRVIVGAVVAAHGAQKLFGWFGGGGLHGTSTMFASLGFRPPRPYAILAGATEFLGGLLLVAGFLTPLGSAAVMGMMLAAIVTVHGSKGFSNSKGGWEFNATLAGSAWALAFTGPGRASVDQAADLALLGGGWGLAALSIALVMTIAVLVSRVLTARSASPVMADEPNA